MCIIAYMKTTSDRFFVLYKKRNKNVWVTKKVNNYLLKLSHKRIRAELLQDYKSIIQTPVGSYQTPLNQLEFISLLAQTNDAQKILEVGTFRGFTSLYLSLELGKKSQITTCELVDDNIKFAQELWSKYDIGKQITMLEGDALKSIKALSGTYDLIYIDADKKQYPEYYVEAKRLCKKGGLILIDNMLWAGLVAEQKSGYSHATLLDTLNKKIYQDDNASVSMIPAWDGLLIIKR